MTSASGTNIGTSCAHFASTTLNLATGAPAFTCIVAGTAFDSNGSTAATFDVGLTLDSAPNCYQAISAPASTAVENVINGIFTGVTPGTHTFNLDASATVAPAGSGASAVILCVPQR